MPPPGSSFISFATAACKIAVILTTIGYAGMVAHRMRAQNAQLLKEIDEARGERERLLQEAASQRSRTASMEQEKQEEAGFWRRMESLARGALTEKNTVLKEKEAELLAQREQIHDFHVDLGDARPGQSSTLSPLPEGSRVSETASSPRAELVLDVASTIASTDEVVLHMVRTLNLEISEVASQVTNAFHVADTPDPERVTQAFDRTREAVGPVMAELLESIQHQEDPILIDIALKADMVGFAAEIASAWDFQHQIPTSAVALECSIAGLTRVAGCVRTMAFAHTELAERIADLLAIAGAASTAEEIYAAYTAHLETIVRTALDLQRVTGEELLACDYEVLAVRIDEVFDNAEMEDIYNGEITAAGPPGTVPRVLSTADLGLRRSQVTDGDANNGADGDDGTVTTMLLKPKVVLDTIVYELGLVDEEDASTPAAEPST